MYLKLREAITICFSTILLRSLYMNYGSQIGSAQVCSPSAQVKVAAAHEPAREKIHIEFIGIVFKYYN
jgi:hypothetical protein